MLTRRLFTACGLCAAAGFLASEADADTTAPPGLKRTLIKQTDGPVDGYATIEMRIELAPGAAVARHTHPGIESGYVAEGGTELTIEGQGALKLGARRRIPGPDPHAAWRRERAGQDRHHLDLCRRKGQTARFARLSRKREAPCPPRRSTPTTPPRPNTGTASPDRNGPTIKSIRIRC